MSRLAIKVEHLSKAYQLGQIGTGTISRDIERWWTTKVLRKEDPFLTIGADNNFSVKNTSGIVWSLRDINLEINQGDVVGIIGKNGAGKSTLLKLLSRVTAPTDGRIKIKGRIASLLEVGTGFHPELTGRENIFLNGAILGMRKQEIARKLDEIIAFSGIESYIDTPVKRYSSGMYVRLAFAVAAHLESEILIVDEVLAVGDAEFQKKCLGKMDLVSKSEGRTVLFVSHNMSVIRQLCKNGVLLKNGFNEDLMPINDVLNSYLHSQDNVNISKVINAIDCEVGFKNDDSLTVNFIHFELLNPGFQSVGVNEPIRVRLRIKGLRTGGKFRIGCGICDMLDEHLGVTFTQDIEPIQVDEIKDLVFVIANHNLADGRYYLNFSIGTGNVFSNNINDSLILNKCVYFDIVGMGNFVISKWNSLWGSNLYSSSIEYMVNVSE